MATLQQSSCFEKLLKTIVESQKQGFREPYPNPHLNLKLVLSAGWTPQGLSLVLVPVFGVHGQDLKFQSSRKRVSGVETMGSCLCLCGFLFKHDLQCALGQFAVKRETSWAKSFLETGVEGPSRLRVSLAVSSLSDSRIEKDKNQQIGVSLQ